MIPVVVGAMLYESVVGVCLCRSAGHKSQVVQDQLEIFSKNLTPFQVEADKITNVAEKKFMLSQIKEHSERDPTVYLPWNGKTITAQQASKVLKDLKNKEEWYQKISITHNLFSIIGSLL
jgi:hypothetical protein